MKRKLKNWIWGNQSGFSLLEMIVVVSILAIALAVAIPSYNSTIKPTAELKAAARQLFSDIQLAKLRAVTENTSIGLAFSTAPDSYTVFIDNDSSNTFNVGDQTIKTITFSQDYGNVTYDTGSGGGDGISFAGEVFTMTSRALPSNAGTVFLRNVNNEGRSVVVNQTGGVRIQEYTP